MDALPDTSADVLEYGLGTSGKPYLGDLTVAEGVVRGFLAGLLKVRSDVAAGKTVDANATIADAAARLQTTFFGTDQAFAAGPWFSEQHLGRALVEGANLGGDRSDAVVRCGYAMAAELGVIMQAADGGNLSDDDLQFRVDVMVEFWTHVFMGLPVPSADDEE